MYAEIARCTRCSLSQARLKTVPGEGPENADIMFIGEAPGFHENQQGRPFVGAAGKFLDELLASIDLRREDVYICNVVKCRPPGNRDPMTEEIEACRPFLDLQIELVKPKMIVTLGRYSMARYFPNAKISQIHGRPRKMAGIIYYPMYHPAAALHQPRYRADIERDMLKIPQLLAEIDLMADDERPPQAEQLS
ncbi:MAG: uracil-DNA glycosylase, partial [Chloroflexota bacterium]|nr:uracil-DNA glycosylase [Chloroflexota bacterium]